MDAPTTAPIGGKDYPTTWVQFLDWFHSEQACLDYLEKLRWADGLICLKCGVISQVERRSRGRLICPACRHQATVTADTVFDKTRTELRVWFAAIWYITNQKHGVSALGLQRHIPIRLAWHLVARLRITLLPQRWPACRGDVWGFGLDTDVVEYLADVGTVCDEREEAHLATTDWAQQHRSQVVRW